MKLIKAEKTENKMIPVKEGFGKLSSSLKKNMKRNLIVMGSVLLIGGAVWLNWALFAGVGDEDYDPSYYASGDAENSTQNQSGTNAGVGTTYTFLALLFSLSQIGHNTKNNRSENDNNYYIFHFI